MSARVSGAVAAVLWLAAAALGGSCIDSPRAPRVGALLPAQAAPGQDVEIVGGGFCGSAGGDGTSCGALPDGQVSFGAGAEVSAADAAEWTDERVTVRVPDSARAGAALVVVEVDGVPSAPVAFEVLEIGSRTAGGLGDQGAGAAQEPE